MIVLVLAVTFIITVTIYRAFVPRTRPHKDLAGNTYFIVGDSGYVDSCGHGHHGDCGGGHGGADGGGGH